jgi:hypothetical protein
MGKYEDLENLTQWNKKFKTPEIQIFICIKRYRDAFSGFQLYSTI